MKDVTADILLQCNEQCIEQAVEVVYEEEVDLIIKSTNLFAVIGNRKDANYWVVGLEYITGSHTSHCWFLYQSALQQWQGLNLINGNCFFRSITLAVTGFQQYHHEIRLLITTYI